MLNDLKWKQDETCRKMCLLCEDTYRLAANWSQGTERERYRLLGTASQDTLVFNFNWEAFSSRIGNLWVPVFCITCWSWTSHERHLAESTQFATCNIWLLKGPVVRRPRAVPKGGKGADSRRPAKNWRHVKTLFENIKNIKNIKHFRETPQFPSNSEDFVVPFFLTWFLDSLLPFFFETPIHQDFTHRDSCCQAAPHVVRLDASRCGVTLGLRAFLEKTDGENNDFWGLQSLPDAQVWRNQLFLKAQEIKLGKFTELRLWTCSQSLSVWRCSCCIKTVWLRQGPKWIRLKDGGKLLASQKFPLIRLGFHILFMFHLEVDWCRDGMLCSCGWDGALWSNGNSRVFFFKGSSCWRFWSIKTSWNKRWHLKCSGLDLAHSLPESNRRSPCLGKVWVGDGGCGCRWSYHPFSDFGTKARHFSRSSLRSGTVGRALEGSSVDEVSTCFKQKLLALGELCFLLYAVATEDPMPKPNQIS